MTPDPIQSPQPVIASAGHCREFSRSSFLRSGVAQAGQGLPPIEAGMPLPAGTGLSRRSFVLRSTGLALTVFGAQALGPRAFEEGIASAAAAAPDAPVLVSILLVGGLDGLSVLAPVDDPTYHRLRPDIAIAPSGDPADRYEHDPRLQWHPSAARLKELHAEGKLTVIPAIGYDHANQSHFSSKHFWEVGELNAKNRFGWLGRYLDIHGEPDNPLQGLTMGEWLRPTLAAEQAPIATLKDPAHYGFSMPGVDAGLVYDKALQAYTDSGGLAVADDVQLGWARRAVRDTNRLRSALAPLQGIDVLQGGPVQYPAYTHPFPRRLAAVADMLARGMPLRCVSMLSSVGYDAHGGHAQTMTLFKRDVEAIYAFQRDLEARGLADRVLIQVWSEFGRRPNENGTDGTDHGAGGISFLIGTRAKNQMLGEFPGLDVLDAQDNLRSTVDYRSVYCSLLEQWLGVDAEPIIPGASAFARPTLLAA
jgi:uncharacterized protein (DUF1501 family)